MLTYAIGDVHGCRSRLVDLLARVGADCDGRDHRVVFLGDYIDRGPDSAGVIATVRRLQQGAPDRVVALKGNHEALLLRAVGRPDALPLWLDNGGDATLSSYGVGEADGIPDDDLSWLASCPTSFEDALRIYVHAGLRPGRDPASQTDHDRLWIRDEFLNGDVDFGKFVVHGHTPRRDGRPDVRAYRVNLDTAAVYGGRLTAGVFDDAVAPPVRFLQAL